MGKNLSSVYVYRYDCLVCTKKRKHELLVVRATNLKLCAQANQHLAHQILGKHRVRILVFKNYWQVITKVLIFSDMFPIYLSKMH